MPRISQNVKQNRLSALAQLCEIHIANGLTTTAELVAKTGYEARSIRAARAELECRHSNAARQSNAGNRMPNGNRMPQPSIDKERARLNEQTTSVSSSESDSTRDTPHMNGKGFVISAKHDVYIPTKTVDGWRAKYRHIDLEAVMSNFAAKILARGCMHPGWHQPEAWMVKLIAEENTKAASVAQRFNGAPSPSVLSHLAPMPQNVRPVFEEA